LQLFYKTQHNLLRLAGSTLPITAQIYFGGSRLEEVEAFTYLGSIVNNHGRTYAHVKARIG